MSTVAYAAFVAALWAATPGDGSAADATQSRFAVAQTRLATQPVAQPGQRFAVTGALGWRTAVETPQRFRAKGAIEPGECGITLLFLDGFEN